MIYHPYFSAQPPLPHIIPCALRTTLAFTHACLQHNTVTHVAVVLHASPPCQEEEGKRQNTEIRRLSVVGWGKWLGRKAERRRRRTRRRRHRESSSRNPRTLNASMSALAWLLRRVPCSRLLVRPCPRHPSRHPALWQPTDAHDARSHLLLSIFGLDTLAYTATITTHPNLKPDTQV
ncbi:hypothetical protein K439DRAFT_1077518 [Ramaria rubella]|nr:hypothetical protein K439DRAFT_1077518 [Ramaria rubella]